MITPGSKPVAPARPKRRSEEREPVPFRLIAAGGGLGIELYEQQRRGILGVHELRWSLPGLGFPVDLSGGVRAFRHRRGHLERLTLGVDLEEVARWLEGRVRGMLGGLRERPRVWLVPCGIAVGINGVQGALSFELLWAPVEDSARWVVAEARCGGFPGPALGHALHVVDTAFGRWATRRGRVIEIPGLPGTILKQWLPELGVRAPDARAVQWADFVVSGEQVTVSAAKRNAPYALPEPTVRALELGRLTETADNALFAEELDVARSEYVSALERAPRHPELCHLIAAIDVGYRERAEAALGLLVESLPATSFGIVGAELLAGVGDEEGASLAISRQASAEPYAPLAALWWLRLSELSTEPTARREALDQAVAASPSNEPARVARFKHRVEHADLNGALADAEHLEAGAKGGRARQERLATAARVLLEYGFVQPAGKLFERALRYQPNDAAATLGLAESLIETQRPERALVLLERCIELSEDDEVVRSRASLSLSKLLAASYRDLPQAIARAREVAGTDPVAIEARALEALWRAQIGDVAGATLGYARFRDCVELASSLEPKAASSWLKQAAAFALESAKDVHAAERHLAVALRLSPHDTEIQGLYREAALRLPKPELSSELVSPKKRESIAPTDSSAEPQAPVGSGAELQAAVVDEPSANNPADQGVALAPPEPELDSEAEHSLSERASALIAQLMVTTGAVDLVSELCVVLSRLRRFEELYALLQARYEDAEPAEQAALRPHLESALAALVEFHKQEGRSDEAELYSQILAALSA